MKFATIYQNFMSAIYLVYYSYADNFTIIYAVDNSQCLLCYYDQLQVIVTLIGQVYTYENLISDFTVIF